MKMVTALPQSEQLAVQTAMIRQLFPNHDISVVTTMEDLFREATTADVLVSTAFFPISSDLLRSAPSLRMVQVAGVGVDHVDIDAAKELGITVACVTGANTVSVAEHVVMSALALIKGLAPANSAMHRGEWALPIWIKSARDMAGTTFGILGMGRIGREVALRLQPFQVTVLYNDIQPIDDEERYGATFVDFDTLMSESDVVSLHLPLNDATRKIIGADALDKMKFGACLVNTARAELIDEAALAKALQNRLGGAAIDVFHPEPPPSDHPLVGLPNVILTPHGAGVTLEAQQRIAQGVIQNVLRFIDGRPLADVVVEGSR